MPILNYICYTCQKEFESIEKVDTKFAHCPSCSSLGERIFSSEGGSFQLKGRCISKFNYEGYSNRPSANDPKEKRREG